MTYRCPHVGCNGVDFIEMRPLYRFALGWFGRVRRVRSGSQVMCTACLSHALATAEGLAMMLRPQAAPNPQADDSPPANGQRRIVPRFADLGREP